MKKYTLFDLTVDTLFSCQENLKSIKANSSIETELHSELCESWSGNFYKFDESEGGIDVASDKLAIITIN